MKWRIKNNKGRWQKSISLWYMLSQLLIRDVYVHVFLNLDFVDLGSKTEYMLKQIFVHFDD